MDFVRRAARGPKVVGHQLTEPTRNQAPTEAKRIEASTVLEDVVLPPRGFLRARVVSAGELVRFTDVHGQQVVDIVLLRLGHPGDWLSCLNTKLLNGTDRITTGHQLVSKTATPLATIVEDTVGRHWFGGGFCSEPTNRARYGVEGTVNCRTNLTASLEGHVNGPLDVELDSCASLFMNIEVAADGRFAIAEPLGRAEDHLTLRAECDLLLAASNCPADRNPCNGYDPTEMRVTIAKEAPSR